MVQQDKQATIADDKINDLLSRSILLHMIV